ncbi:MAG: hypothetical protein J6Q15_00310 [Clostridia bacterium]|nr:hypothetical protein [Clostridia bacterium]
MLKLTNFIYRPEAEVNNKFINSTTDCHYVSKELIYKAFREFSFNQLRDLNQQQTF